MKKWLALISFMILLGISGDSFAQEIGTDAKSPKHSVSSPLQKKAEKKKEAQRADIEKSDAKMRKALYKMQSKEVKKRMRQSKRESTRINERKKEPFLKKLFRKKHH